MRHIVYGAGAVGGLVGARLHESGADVVFVARGAHYEAMRDGGLRVEAPTGTTVVRIPVVDDPRSIEFRPDDAILLCVKSQDTGGILPLIAEIAPPDITFVSVQNGVANEPAALRYFEHVYGVCVVCPATHVEPGVVETGIGPINALLDLGRFPDGVDQRAEAVAEAFREAMFESQARPDIMRWKYEKLLSNLVNAIDALSGRSELLRDLHRRAITEAEACFEAAGIAVASREEVDDRRAALMAQPGLVRNDEAGGGIQRGGSSTRQSLARGTGTVEADHLNGEIVWLGRINGVPTPVNEMLRSTANRAAREHWAPASMSAEDLIRLLPDDE
jgi:2-dehydropantoate 2-reductase